MESKFGINITEGYKDGILVIAQSRKGPGGGGLWNEWKRGEV
jgi:hypothetical protein